MWARAHACATPPSRVTEPPAFSIASTADLDAPWTWKDSLALSSPTPRIFTPSRGLETTPAATSDSTVTAAALSSLPASMACWMRPTLTSLRSIAFGLLKPRFGRRRCRGIWPPSKPLIATPERDVCPLTPRPPVLPLPEPIPRPTRMRFLVEPSLSRISLSFMTFSSLPVDNAHEVLDLFDHAAHRRGVGKRRGPMKLVELQADQRLALLGVATDRRPDLLNGDGGCCSLRLVCHCVSLPYASAPAASPSTASRRRAWSVETFRPRRAATEPGLSSFLRASKVARTRLYGFDEPRDLDTTS